MKKVFVIIFMLTSAVSFNQVAKAEDGSLKIDAETKKNNKTVYRIIKGGSWFSEASWCSVLPRFCYNSIYSSKEIGFRIVRTV